MLPSMHDQVETPYAPVPESDGGIPVAAQAPRAAQDRPVIELRHGGLVLAGGQVDPQLIGAPQPDRLPLVIHRRGSPTAVGAGNGHSDALLTDGEAERWAGRAPGQSEPRAAP